MEDLEKRAIEDLPVVSSVRLHAGDKTHRADVYTNLRCCAVSSYGGCGAKLVGTIRKSIERPTNVDCFRELGRVIQRDHDPTCIVAAQELQAAEKAAAHASTKRPVDEAAASLNANDVLMLRAQLKSLGERVVIANKTSLEAEKARDELHNQIEHIEEQLHPKRTRTHDDVGDTHEMLAEVENWDLRDHRQQATRVQNRHNVQLGSRQNQVKPRAGTDGFLHHTRLGLVGWIAYWCLGDSVLAVDIIVALIKTLDLTELVSDALATRYQKQAETNAKIVDLFKEVLDEIKNCRTEQQRVEFHIALACVMSSREAQGSKTGWIKPIYDRLGLKRGKRSEKNGTRPYASEQTVENRVIFNKDRELLTQPVKVGDMVLLKGQLCELTGIGEGVFGNEGPSCVLVFRAGTVTQEHKYSTMYGIGKDSARLKRPPPSLTPGGHAQRKDTVSERTRQLVKLHAYDTCAESPSKRDAMNKKVGPRVWEHRQALILTCTKDTLWFKFNETYPNLLGVTQYFMVRPSNRFTTWVPGGMYSPWITTMSSGHDVSEYELGASGLPRAYVSPQQPWKN